MVLHDIQHFDNYLLAKLEQLEQQQSPESGEHAVSRVDGSGGPRLTTTRSKPLPNLLEKTLVARFMRSQVNPGQRDARSGRGTLHGTSCSRGLDKAGCGAVQDAWPAVPTSNGGLSAIPISGRRKKERKALSAPCGRDDDTEKDDQSLAEARERAAAAARIHRVIDTVKQSRRKWIMDRALGVPPRFAFEKPHFKLVYDKSGQYHRKPSHIPTSGSCEDVRSNRSVDEESDKDDKSKKPVRPEIPGFYPFPKEKNFIPHEFLSVEEAGIDWSLSRSKPRAAPAAGESRPPPPPLAPAPTDVRRRCRVSYPVTEALHRAGTSITKIKAQTPKELKVVKVWQETADPSVPPAHLARTLHVELPKSKQNQVPILSPYRIPYNNQAQLAN